MTPSSPSAGGYDLVDWYRIEKQRLAVTLKLLGGVSVRGHVFLGPTARGYHDGEDPVRVFNAPEPFLPIELESGEVLLVAKNRVEEVWGMTLAAEDDVRLASARSMRLEVRLAGGSAHCGCVAVELPAQQARLLDFLNQHDARFLTLHTPEGTRLLNTRQIESVRPLD
jgi:hypothetical protein